MMILTTKRTAIRAIKRSAIELLKPATTRIKKMSTQIGRMEHAGGRLSIHGTANGTTIHMMASCGFLLIQDVENRFFPNH